MRDLIDRAEAIDALEEPRKVSDTWTDEYAVGERMQWEKDVKALNSLPSAQPTQPNTPNALDALDCISRQAAIDALENTECELLPEEWDELTDAIMNVPSAQPDIVRCKDCKHYIKSESYCDYLGITISDHDFCSYAERREE